MRRHAALLVGLVIASACGARTELEVGAGPSSVQGTGGAATGGGGSGAGGDGGGGAVPCIPVELPSLVGRVRDQTPANPDFEGAFLGDDRGIVLSELGPDRTPVYAGAAGHPSTHGGDAFFAWFHDVDGVNLGKDFTLPLVPAGSAVAFVSDEFFPIDGDLLGNEGRPHNFHFTLAVGARFTHTGGERLTFAGDDDLFVFMNERLVLDLGGVHSTESGQVEVDALAPSLGLEVGADYALDLFFAERHTTGSTFHLTLEGFRFCEAP
jgi:fibro-slime domain-containing protein